MTRLEVELDTSKENLQPWSIPEDERSVASDLLEENGFSRIAELVRNNEVHLNDLSEVSLVLHSKIGSYKGVFAFHTEAISVDPFRDRLPVVEIECKFISSRPVSRIDK